METKQAIEQAKSYLHDVYAEERITDVTLDEIEHFLAAGNWIVTLSFSRPWTTPRTRAQEVLENLGAASSLRRATKVLTMTDDGMVLSMKDPARAA